MANATMMFDVLDEPEKAAAARGSVEKLLIVGVHEAYCQPCVSPVWDTALACHALLEAGAPAARAAALRGLDWLVPRQVLDVRGDWVVRRPDVRPGGWAFQYNNAHYPDLDDTAVVVMAMDRARRTGAGDRFDRAIARGTEWILGLQSSNGGWAAFDVDNTYDYLNNIPFADHGALIDPPTEDVTARCVSMLAQLGYAADNAPLSRGIDYLLRTQRSDGSWYGRWGVNYIYGTWSSLCALSLCRRPETEVAMRKAADWLTAVQNPDGGWGEGGDSYRLDYDGYRHAPSTASQTAWATLGLMAASGAGQPAVKHGVDFLRRTQGDDGFWYEPYSTGGGFPRVFYLRYHGYSKFFPLWALARYRNLIAGGQVTLYGM
jgi:squalene-hopene/tetraprenyl-beta-curcumene cyclase